MQTYCGDCQVLLCVYKVHVILLVYLYDSHSECDTNTTTSNSNRYAKNIYLNEEPMPWKS